MNNAVVENVKIGVIGLGYVGLPLAVEFSKKYKVFGFDIQAKRIEELKAGHDNTLEVSEDELKHVLTQDCTKETGLFCTNEV